jgi:hypothetical protein
MKKLSTVALSLVLATAMMGAGYAAWSQTLDLSNTVDTAEFSFTLTNGTVTPSATTGQYLEANTAIADGDTLNVDIDNAYPGAKATVSETITNASTIPASLTLANTVPDEFTMDNIQVNGDDYTAGMNIPTGNVTITYDLTASDDVVTTESYTISSTATFEQNTTTAAQP